jgi:hypothetical protein
MTKLQTMARRPFAALALVALAALLGACHHNDDDRPPPVAETPPPPPPVATDAFITYVSQQVATQSDSAEPLSTDGVSVTTPEDTEPLPVPGS